MSRIWGKPEWSAEETRRRFQAEQRELSPMFVPEESLDNDDLSQISNDTIMSTFLPPAPKRRRIATGRAAASIDNMGSSLPSPVVSPQTMRQPPVRVKSEAETEALAKLYLKPSEQRVKIYVGKNNTVCEVGLEDLEKSPVLKSLVNSTDTSKPFIMHPELTVILTDHFQAVREFLLTDEYMPAMMDNPKGQAIFPKLLGDCTTIEDYRREALRGAHLYLIAKGLAMSGMQDLVFRKITTAQYREYGIKCLLDMAQVVFSSPQKSVLIGKGKSKAVEGDNGSKSKIDGNGDPLEDWLIQMLGSKLRRVMIDHAKQFFKVAENGACLARGFGIRVLRWKVNFWDEAGQDVIPIEDDD
ncbi:hypothetical protein H2200_005273 [Cladophialophora chaetospira]|uniref:BTB domain-containing protein n=1 Tax=Cladophialophora chaetospira TaxID=386627 RepID=A0AA38XC98_9EURO|nr:hypothetical protein H2200_005273 [Cladophialophora chaetospira]